LLQEPSSMEDGAVRYFCNETTLGLSLPSLF